MTKPHDLGRKTLSGAQEFFARIAGEDMAVDANELQEILNHALKKGIQCLYCLRLTSFNFFPTTFKFICIFLF